MLSTDQKGAVAELAIAHRAAELGVGVWHSFTVERYDLIFDLRDELVRVQCKWAARHGDVLIVRCCSHRRNCDGLVRRRYLPGEIDAFAAYCPELDRCYFSPTSASRGEVQFSCDSRRRKTTKCSESTGPRISSSRLDFAATGP